MKKILAILLAMSMLLALAVPVVAAEPTFTNVVFEDLTGDTLKDDDSYHNQWDTVFYDTFGIDMADVKEYAAMGGVKFQMLFAATGFATYEPKYAPDAKLNVYNSGECGIPMTVAQYPSVEGITLPSDNHKLYVASVELDDLMVAFGGDAADIQNFAIQLWSFEYTLYTAWFTNDADSGVTFSSFDVTWNATFVENEWNSSSTIVEGSLVGAELGGNGSINIWPAILAKANNDASIIKSVDVSASIVDAHSWDRQNEGAEGQAGPGANIKINSDWTDYEVDWGLVDGNNFGLVAGQTFNTDKSFFADVTKVQVSVFGGDPYTEQGYEVCKIVVTVVFGSIPTKTFAASIGETKFVKLADAVAAVESGDTLKLESDCTTDLLLLYPGVTLDLNGYTLTADKAVSFNTAHIVDNSEAKTGLLAVDEDSLSIGSANNAQMPLLTDNGYAFATMKMQQRASYDAENDALSITLKPSFGTAFNSTFADGMADKGVKVVIRVSWTDGNTTVNKDFRYNEDFVKTVYAANSGFSFTATGLGNYSDVTVTVMVISDLKVECAGESIVPTAIV